MCLCVPKFGHQLATAKFEVQVCVVFSVAGVFIFQYILRECAVVFGVQNRLFLRVQWLCLFVLSWVSWQPSLQFHPQNGHPLPVLVPASLGQQALV